MSRKTERADMKRFTPGPNEPLVVLRKSPSETIATVEVVASRLGIPMMTPFSTSDGDFFIESVETIPGTGNAPVFGVRTNARTSMVEITGDNEFIAAVKAALS